MSQITKMNSFRCEKQRFLRSLSWLANIKIILRINTKVKHFFQKIQKVFKSQFLGAFSTVYHNILLVILHINAIKSHKSTLLLWMWSVDVNYSVEIATALTSLAMTNNKLTLRGWRMSCIHYYNRLRLPRRRLAMTILSITGKPRRWYPRHYPSSRYKPSSAYRYTWWSAPSQ